MKWTFSNIVTLAGSLACMLQPAMATDLSTYPTGLLGPVSRAATSLPSGVMQCEIKANIGQGEVPYVEYTSAFRLVFDGIKQEDDFGRFLAGSSVYYTARFGNSPGVPQSCQQKLDITASKYTMNKNRQGAMRLVVLADDSNSSCFGYTSQWVFLLDNGGNNAYLTADDATQNGGISGQIGDGQCRRP